MNRPFKVPSHFARSGFSLLLSVLILGAVSSTIVFSVLLSGVDAERMSYTQQLASQAKNGADGCVELALQELRDDDTFTGTLTHVYAQGSCEATVIDTGGQTREIQAKGSINDVVQRVRMSVSKLTPDIEGVWEDVSDF